MIFLVVLYIVYFGGIGSGLYCVGFGDLLLLFLGVWSWYLGVGVLVVVLGLWWLCGCRYIEVVLVGEGWV